MTYQITLTDGTVLTSVPDLTTNTSALPITIFGKGIPNYGNGVNENFIGMLENFANATAPVNPIRGMLWWDDGNEILKVRNSTGNWISLQIAGSNGNQTFNGGISVTTNIDFRKLDGTVTNSIRRTSDSALHISTVSPSDDTLVIGPWNDINNTVTAYGARIDKGTFSSVNQVPYGFYNNAVAASFIAGSGEGRALFGGGFEAGIPAMATNPYLDRGAVFVSAQDAGPGFVITGATIGVTRILLNNPLTSGQQAYLRPQMFLTTNNATASGSVWSTQVTAWDTTAGNWIDTIGWVQAGSNVTTTGLTPSGALPNGQPQTISVNAFNRMFGQIIVVNTKYTDPTGQAKTLIGLEIDLANNATIDVPSTETPLSIGLNLVSNGTRLGSRAISINTNWHIGITNFANDIGYKYYNTTNPTAAGFLSQQTQGYSFVHDPAGGTTGPVFSVNAIGSMTLANSIEIGIPGTVFTPFIDFHSSGQTTDYDTRIISIGGTSIAGKGQLDFEASLLTFNGSPIVTNASAVSGIISKDNPKAAGLIGDGTFRALSSIASVVIYGVVINTSTYNLSQWQSLLPAATALYNGFDRLILQKFINDAANIHNVQIDQDTHIVTDATIILPGYTNLIINGSITLANAVNSHIIRLMAGGDYITVSGKGILDGNKAHQTFNTDPANFGNGGIVTLVIAYPTISNRYVKIKDLTIRNVLNWPISLNNSTHCEVTGTTLTDSGNAPQFMGGTTYSIASNNTMANIPDYAWATYEGCSYCTVSNNIATNCGPFGCLNDGDGSGVSWYNVGQHDIIIEGNIMNNCFAAGIIIATVVSNCTPVFLYNISVRGNTINNSLDSGIILSGVRNSVIEGNIITGGRSSSTTWSGINGICINVLFSKNLITQGGANGAGITACSAFSVTNISASIFVDNYIFDYGGTMLHAFSGTMGVGAALQFRNNIIGTLAGSVFAPEFIMQPDTIFIGPMTSNSLTQSFTQPVSGSSGIASVGNINANQWVTQGTWMGWNQTVGTGAASFINSRGLGSGGFEFFDVASSSTATPLLINKIDAAGNMTLTGNSIQLKNGTSLHRTVNSVVFAQANTVSAVSLTSNGAALSTANAVLVLPLNCCVRVRAEIQVHNLTSAQAATWVIEALVAIGASYAGANIVGSIVTPKIPSTAPAGFSVGVGVNTTNGALDIFGTCTVAGSCLWHADAQLGINGG